MTSSRVLLLVLAFANFVVGMGAFVAIGILSPVATAFAISKAQAGWVLTAYAMVYAVSSPLLVAGSGRLDRAPVLVAGLGLFTLGAACAAAAPSFALLLAARALMALGGALVTPVAASVGIAASPPERRGQALATVFGGLTLAQVLGVPAGAWLGYAYGWQVAFGAVAALALLSVVVLWRLVPRGLAVPPASLATLRQVLATPRLMLAVAFTAFFIGGLYTLYTFLAPLAESRQGLGRDGVTTLLLVFGVGAVVGNSLGGWLTDRVGTERALAVLCVIQVVVMPLLSLWAAPLLVFGAGVALWSVFAWSFNVPQQARLAQLDPPRTPVLFALNAAAIYVGSSVGSSVGGAVLTRAGFDALGLAGSGLMALALLSLWWVRRKAPQPVAA